MVEHGDFSEEFNAIIGELRDEQNDPIVAQVLESVTQAEEALNRQREVTHEQAYEVTASLNNELDEAGLLGSEVIVSGIIRPSDYIADGVDARTDELIKSQFGDLGPLRNDDKGPYYIVEQKQFVCGAFDIESVSANGDPENEELIHKVVLSLNVDEQDDPTMGMVYAYPDELTVLAPVEMSALKAAHELERRYPQIIEQLAPIADAEGEAAKIDALRQLTLTIDWGAYPYLDEDGRNQLVAMIETYITNLLRLDSVMYTLTIHGDVIGFDINRNEMIRPVEQPTQLHAYMDVVRMRNDEDEDTYTAAFEVFAPADDRENGSHMLHIPAESLVSAVVLRNANLFTDEMGTYETPVPDTTVTPVIDAEQTTDEEIYGEADDERMYEDDAWMERHAQVDSLFAELFEAAGTYVRTYETVDEAKAASDALAPHILKLLSEYPRDFYPLICAEGEGVVHTKAAYNPNESHATDGDDQAAILQFDHVDIRRGDMFVSKQGLFAFDQTVNMDVQIIPPADGESEPMYRPSVYLRFRDVDEHQPITLGTADSAVGLFTLMPVRQFMVKLDPSMSVITLPAYERAKRIDESISSIEKDFSDLEFLPVQLRDLFADIRQSAPSPELEEMSDPDLLAKIADQVAGDEDALTVTVDTLTQILEGCEVQAKGPMYTADGTRYDEVTLRGRVTAVVPTIASIDTQEPLIVVVTEDNTWYIPIAELTEFKY